MPQWTNSLKYRSNNLYLAPHWATYGRLYALPFTQLLASRYRPTSFAISCSLYEQPNTIYHRVDLHSSQFSATFFKFEVNEFNVNWPFFLAFAGFSIFFLPGCKLLCQTTACQQPTMSPLFHYSSVLPCSLDYNLFYLVIMLSLIHI